MNEKDYKKQIDRMRKQPVPNFGWERASKKEYQEAQKKKGK